MAAKSVDQRALAELLAGRVAGFGDAIGVEGEHVSGEQSAFSDGAIPLREEAKESAGGIEPLTRAIRAQNQAGQVAAVRVAQALLVVIVQSEKKRGVGTVDRVLVEQAVHGLEQEFRTIQGQSTLAAQVGLEIGHEKSGGDAFAGNVA